MNAQDPFSENRILHLLSAADLTELRPSLKEFPMVQGTVLHAAGSAIEHIYFPVSGMVSKLVVMKSGEQIETGIIGREGIVGASIGNGGPLAFGQATVQINGLAWQLPRSKFLSMLNKSAGLRELVNEYQGFLYFQSQQSAACHAVHSVEQRLSRWMLQSQDLMDTDNIELTQEFLSHMMGVQRNAVSLSAHALQSAGLIQYTRGSIKILDRKGLEAEACECYQATRDYADKMTPAPLTRPAHKAG